MTVSNIGSYEERLQDFSWDIAREVLNWKDGELLNIGHMCSDRICAQGKADKTALVWEGFTGEKRNYTFDEVRILSNGYAKFLQDQGVKPGDRVCIFMEKIPALYISFLGVLKMGGVAQPLFSAFEHDSLEVRLRSAETKAIITTQKHLKKVRKIIDELPLDNVICVEGNPEKMREGEIFFNVDEADKVEEYECFQSGPETPSVLHYTSGTTGQPKGAQHVHSSMWGQALTSQVGARPAGRRRLLVHRRSRLGHRHQLRHHRPWALGATSASSTPASRAIAWYKFIQENKVTVWYSAPTAIRSLMRDGTDLVKKHDLSSLRHLCSVGEPLNAEAVVWSEEAFGKPFHDTFWQTETGA
jgi:acetyl-CoA synthetase